VNYIIVKRPQTPAELLQREEITLEDLQSLVGAQLEGLSVPFEGEEETIYCNEDGGSDEMMPNIVLTSDVDGDLVVKGPLVVVHTDEDGVDGGFPKEKALAIADALNAGAAELSTSSRGIS
jgi:hypothetical protein